MPLTQILSLICETTEIRARSDLRCLRSLLHGRKSHLGDRMPGIAKRWVPRHVRDVPLLKK
jgi:hypothetical protein